MTPPWYRRQAREAEIARLRQVVAWRLEGLTYAAIALKLGVSKNRAWQLGAVSQTFVELRRPGVHAAFDRRGQSPHRVVEQWIHSRAVDE